MKSAVQPGKIALAALALALGTAPATADVKKGVDAWSQGDYAAAVKEWTADAKRGDADAQYNLGYAYRTGKGVRTDIDAALEWYKKAAAQGHLRAADSVGHILHYQGKIAEALPYLQASSDRGDPRAQYLLGVELFNGQHIQKDWVRAYALMTRASSAGMSNATKSLQQMDQFIPLEQRQQGIVLAGDLEQRASQNREAQIAGFPIDTTPPKPTAKPVKVPPAKVPTNVEPSYQPGAPYGQPSVASKPPVTQPAVTKPAPAQAYNASDPVGGDWRIQLGAFGDESRATKLWRDLQQRVSALTGLTPILDAAGSVTRLRAGPFASRAAAEAMCAKVKAAGQDCIAVPRTKAK